MQHLQITGGWDLLWLTSSSFDELSCLPASANGQPQEPPNSSQNGSSRLCPLFSPSTFNCRLSTSPSSASHQSRVTSHKLPITSHHSLTDRIRAELDQGASYV